MKIKIIMTIWLSLLLQTLAFAESNIVTFKNKRGSILTLNLDKGEILTGTFKTAVASKECQEAINLQRPLTGFKAENAITFSVNYPKCGSVLTFIGNIDEAKGIIDTTAILARNATDISTEGPGSRLIVHDVFKKISA